MNTASRSISVKPALTFRRQSNKLAHKETDWNLAGSQKAAVITTRTRNGGSGRPCFVHRKKAFIKPLSSGSDSESLVESESGEEDVDDIDEILEPLPVTGVLLNEDEQDTEADTNKPPNTLAILEVAGLLETLTTHCRCPCCDAAMKPRIATLCLSSTVILDCFNEICGYVHESPDTAKAKVGRQEVARPSRNRSTDYAINILWVLGFISIGDGCSEAAGRLLGLLGLPNDTTMESRSFTIIEERISPYIHRLTEEILQENLTEEVRHSVTPEDFHLWKRSHDEGRDLFLGPDKYPKLDASYDMA
jgi:hypothetical protein